VLPVGIERDGGVCAEHQRSAQAAAQGRTLPGIFCVPHHHRACFARDLTGRITRAVIHDEHAGDAGGGPDLHQSLHDVADCRLGLVRGHDGDGTSHAADHEAGIFAAAGDARVVRC
jgi:hypothetical protein